MTSHTPGPWHSRGSIVYNDAGWAVANAVIYHGRYDQPEMVANARIIAAAPLLLAALERAADWLEELPPPHGREALAQAREAIAAAKGDA